MAGKPSNLIPPIPTIGELLETQPIRALTDRWNRSTVAAGLRSFLDEIRSDLRRRAADAGIPSPRELAERAAQHVIALQQHSRRPAINATGRIVGGPWLAGPLHEAALERLYAIGRDFVAEPRRDGDRAMRPLSGTAEAVLCRLTGAQAATAVHSYAGALWMTLATLASDREVLVARSEMGDVECGMSLAALAATTGAKLVEVGTTNRASAGDYKPKAFFLPKTAAILKHRPDDYAVVGESETIALGTLARLVRERGPVLIDALGTAPLVDLPSLVGLGRRSARASLLAGAGLVLVRGDGLIGGPVCGLVLGNRDHVRLVEEHPLFAAWRIDPLTWAALGATLELYESASGEEPPLPLLDLLATPTDNLRNRAERLAPQLAQVDGIGSAAAITTESRLFPALVTGSGLASYGIALVPADDDVAALAGRLAAAPQPVLGRIEPGRLVLDLRTVPPRQDAALIATISGGRLPYVEE